MFKWVLIAALLLGSAQALTVKRSTIILNHAPILGFSVRVKDGFEREFCGPWHALESLSWTDTNHF